MKLNRALLVNLFSAAAVSILCTACSDRPGKGDAVDYAKQDMESDLKYKDFKGFSYANGEKIDATHYQVTVEFKSRAKTCLETKAYVLKETPNFMEINFDVKEKLLSMDKVSVILTMEADHLQKAFRSSACRDNTMLDPGFLGIAPRLVSLDPEDREFSANQKNYVYTKTEKGWMAGGPR